jgi:hypothetical protein
MLEQFMTILTYWEVWLGMILFCLLSVGGMKAFAPLPLSNRAFSVLMTINNFLYVTVLVVWLGPILLLGQGAYGSARGMYAFNLVHILIYGLIARALFGILPFPSPNPAAMVQGTIQLATVAHDFFGTRVHLWPGWISFLVMFAVGLGLIFATEALIVTGYPKKKVTITVAMSGALVTLPILMYASWLRSTNPALGASY